MSMSVNLLNQALSPLARIFGDGMTADHLGSKFTCSEADEIALALWTAGHRDAAVTWLVGHTDGEDWEDGHAHEEDPAQGDDDRNSPRVFNEDEIREHLRALSENYLDALKMIAAA